MAERITMLHNQLHRPDPRRGRSLRGALRAGSGRLAAICLLAAAGTTPALARTSSAFIPAGEIADPPAGFVDMCHRDRILCEAGLHPVETTPGGNAAALDDGVRSLVAVERRSSAGSDAVSQERTMFATSAGCEPARSQAERPGSGSALSTRYLTVSYTSIPTGGSVPVMDGGSCDDRDRAALRGHNRLVTAALLTPVEPVSARALPAPADSRTEGDVRPALKLLRHVNLSVNGSVFQESDLQHNGVEEYWERPDRVHPVGDCEDIAIEKRMRLLEAGFAPSKLFFAVAYSSRFGLHTVLIARLTDADYVLDSLTADLLRWSQVRYRWLRVQSTADPMIWTRVRTPGESLAATTATAQIGVAAREAESVKRPLLS